MNLGKASAVEFAFRDSRGDEIERDLLVGGVCAVVQIEAVPEDDDALAGSSLGGRRRQRLGRRGHIGSSWRLEERIDAAKKNNALTGLAGTAL
jgi:hypothetical protein